MYHVNDITADINSILSGKLDQLNPHLFNTLLADFVGTSEISRAFVTQLSNGYLNKLTTLPRHPAIVQGLADSRTAQLAAIDHEIVSEKARLLKTRKKFDTEISRLERHGPRRHLQRVRNERDSLIEIAQKRIDKLQSNPEQIADSRTLRNYGVLVAERVISGLNELPLTTRTAFFNH